MGFAISSGHVFNEAKEALRLHPSGEPLSFNGSKEQLEVYERNPEDTIPVRVDLPGFIADTAGFQ